MKAQCPDSQCLFAFYGGETVYHKYLIGLQFYNVFLFFWCANFVIALGQMTLAGAFASYYWAFVKPDDMPAFPVFSSLGRSLRCVCVCGGSSGTFHIWHLFILYIVSVVIVLWFCFLFLFTPKETVFHSRSSAVFQVSYRKPGIWLPHSLHHSDHQGSAGVSRPQAERFVTSVDTNTP